MDVSFTVDVWHIGVVIVVFAVSLGKIHTDLYWIKKNINEIWGHVNKLKGS